MANSKKILCVGLVCVDVVNLVEKFPVEDTDMRTKSQWRARGGNASNNCTVLADLSRDCEFLGTLGDDNLADFVRKDFEDSGIPFSNCPTYKGHFTPNSCVIVSQKNGSRTILHTNLGLPELPLETFTSLNFSHYSWVHFEGRNIENISRMAEFLSMKSPRPKMSLEIEKTFRDCSTVLPFVDLVFVSKEYALSKGAKSKFDLVEDPVAFLGKTLNPRAIIITPWGEEGALARNPDGEVTAFDAVQPSSGSVVDTIGAGDTFIAVVVACLAYGQTLSDSVKAGCRVAGNKVGQQGFKGLRRFFENS